MIISRPIHQYEPSTFDFQEIKLKLHNLNITEVFEQLDPKKTLKSALQKKPYRKLADEVKNSYGEYLETPLGQFLKVLKKENKRLFESFLNDHGDQKYAHFYLDLENPLIKQKGIYAYCLGKEIKYLGRCKDSFKKRVNEGYGKIHPKNCYKDGQSTNCHINSLVNENWNNNITFWVHTIKDNYIIDYYEALLIKHYKFEWNRKLK